MSIPDFYDPYYLSGAKLTYYINKKVSLQACIFNGYNEYIDNNKNKALDFTLNYHPTEHMTMTYNFLTCDETPDANPVRHQRYYQNYYVTWQKGPWTWGLDVNFGLQQRSLKRDTSKTASMYAGTLTGKYNFSPKVALYSRGETFSDPNDILTGRLDVGSFIHGITIGTEYKAMSNMSMSAEWRLLEADKKIFFHDARFHNQRNEIIICLDLWF
jgi:outer membrane receptor for ferrienterochelin and colicin